MDESGYEGKMPRVDLDEAFPADLVDTLGPALLGDSRPTTAALVAAYLLRLAARAGGTRVRPSAIDAAIDHLERAVAADARRWCEDEAKRIARWTVEPPSAEPPEGLAGDRAVMAEADLPSRRALVEWAIAEGLDVELEWFDEAEDRWPRLRATPRGLEQTEDELLLRLRTTLAEIAVPLRDVRWLMPVYRLNEPSPHLATVLSFPGAPTPKEEE